MTFTAIDQAHMSRALELAKLGWFTTHPNPRVGCVIAHGERVVGEGWHRQAGAAHAEPLALQQAGSAAKGATAYVTLEPHCFHGKTPPCTRALIEAGIQKVISGVLDPNPKVSGAGVRELEAAGVSTHVGLLEDQARALNLGFEKRMRLGMPRVIVKMAASLDGRVALASGESRWITSEAARADVQRLRASVSAVMTGVDTVIADDPQLNVRAPDIDMGGRELLRVVVDTSLRTPTNARLFASVGKVVIVTSSEEAARARALSLPRADIVRVPAGPDTRVDLQATLRELSKRYECNDVLVEAGPTLAGSLLDLDLCDELIVYFAPKVLGADARAMFNVSPLQRLADALEFRVVSTELVGPDIRVSLAR